MIFDPDLIVIRNLSDWIMCVRNLAWQHNYDLAEQGLGAVRPNSEHRHRTRDEVELVSKLKNNSPLNFHCQGI